MKSLSFIILILACSYVFAEEYNLVIGCESIGSCGKTNNLKNRINFTCGLNESAVRLCQKTEKRFLEAADCDHAPKVCAKSMTWVCSNDYKINVCIDTDLKKKNPTDVLPQGDLNYAACTNYCKSRGLRLPSNNEWLVAANGTKPEDCLPEKIVYPFRTVQERDAHAHDTSVISGVRSNRSRCVSHFGVRDAIGVLGQWIIETRYQQIGSKMYLMGQFNGGLWLQAASTVFYSTTAHSVNYSDYSMGCRCAGEPKTL